MKLLYFIGLSVLSILGLPLTTAKYNNDAPNNTFIEALTFAVAADKWTEFKNINWDFFTAMVTLENMTDLELGGNLGYMKENTYNVTSTSDQAAMTLVPEDNGVVVTCHGFDAIFISESARIRKGIITLSGHAESISHNMSLNNEIIWTSIEAADFNVTGRRLMGIKAGYAIVRIDREQLDFLFEGNLLADIANVFSSSVLPIIMAEIEEALAAQINNELPPIINALFQVDDAYLAIFPKSMPKFYSFRIDFQVPNPPVVTKDYIGFSSRTLWFNIIQGWRDVPSRATPLPYWRYDQPHPLQIMANRYFWDSFCQTYIDSNPGWGFNLTQADLGHASPIQLDTYKLNLYFPGIRQHYAAYNNATARTGLPIRAFFEFVNFTNWDAWEAEQAMGVDMDIIVHFNVSMPDGTEECAMQWYFEKYNWKGNMIVKGLVFHLKLLEGTVPNIKLLSCNFCTEEYPLDMQLYTDVFNTVLAPKSLVLQEFFNPVLSVIPIYWPAEIMDIGQMSDVEFKFYDGYIYLGSQMSWVPEAIPYKALAKTPKPQPTIKDRHRNGKEYKQG